MICYEEICSLCEDSGGKIDGVITQETCLSFSQKTKNAIGILDRAAITFYKTTYALTLPMLQLIWHEIHR